MSCLSQCFVLAFLLFASIQCKQTCDFSDEECMIKAANPVYKRFLADSNNKLDPLFQNVLEGDLQALKFKFTNITLSGLSSCTITKLVCNVAELKYEFNLRCPQVVIDGLYEVKGNFAGTDLNGYGSIVITADDYLIMYKGNYGKFIDEKDQKPHVFIKDGSVETDPQGKVTYKPDRRVGNKEKFELVSKFVNENWRDMEKLMRKPMIYILLTKFLHNYSDILRSYPIDELLVKREN